MKYEAYTGSKVVFQLMTTDLIEYFEQEYIACTINELVETMQQLGYTEIDCIENDNTVYLSGNIYDFVDSMQYLARIDRFAF